MKNNRTIFLLLYLVLTNFLITTGPSGRQKSKTQPPKSAPLKAISKQPQTAQKPNPLNPPPTSATTAAKKEVAPPQQKAKAQDNQLLYELFDKKLNYSAHLTEGVIEYTFEKVLELLAEAKDKPDKQTDKNSDKKIKGHFYGLRYPVYRHLREVISSCSDINAFFCGGVLSSIGKSSASPAQKSSELAHFKKIGAILKKFKFYQIDNQLENDLDRHLNEVKATISQATMNQRERAIIKSHYLDPLILLKERIAKPEIKAILPPRESSLYYAYRKTAKKAINATTAAAHWFKGKFLPYLGMQLFEKYNTYLPEYLKVEETSLFKKGSQVVSPIVGKTWEGVTTAVTQPSTIVTAPVQAIVTLWQKSKLIIPGLKSLAQYDTWKNIGSSVQSTFLSGVFMGYELAVNHYLGLRSINRWLTSALNLVDRSVASNVTAITPTDLHIDNINFMAMSAGFIDTYAQEICDTIVQNTFDLPKSTAILQSVQIELFRHRRTIISELGNPHAFTCNYLYCIHESFADDFTYQVYTSIKSSIEENIIGISEDEAKSQAEQIVEERLSKKNELFNMFRELTASDYDYLDKLSHRTSTDPHNKDDIMYLAKPIPINGPLFYTMMSKFDDHLKKIVDELKSFGARSRTQLIQKYWLSVIDQAYGQKLQSHLTALESDLEALLADANHTINALDANQNPYYFTDKDQDNNPIPIVIPAPKVPQTSAKELEMILRTFYINPLSKIAETLQKEDVRKKLPGGKGWYVKYPMYGAKGSLALGKQAVKTALDNITFYDLLAISGAITATLATGGVAAIPAALVAGASAGLTTMSFSALALGVLDIDFINPPPDGSYLSSAATNAVVDLLFYHGPTGIKKYAKGKTATGIVTDIVTKSKPVTKVKEAIRAHQRISRSY